MFTSLDEVKNFLLNIGTSEILYHVEWRVVGGLIGIAGVSILSYILISQLYRHQKIKKEMKNINVKGQVRPNVRSFFSQYSTKSAKRREQHCDTLIKEFIEYESEKLPIHNWGSFFMNFKYGNEFRQHLKTGYSQVSSLLDVVIESEKKIDELFAVVSEKLKETIRKETEEIIKPDNENSRVEPKPSFDTEAITNHILIEIDDINTWQGFIFKRDSTGARGIMSNNKWFHLHLFNQERADNLVTTLNNIVRNTEISADITNYHLIRKSKEDDSRKFNEQLTNLINGIELKAEVLQGKCNHCS
jgi:hypothetical protein